jgi:glycosyltransferase involved in cell wall biosynthesis
VPLASRRPQVIHIATRYLRGGSERRIGDIVRSFPEADHHLVVGRDSDVQRARLELDPASVTIVTALVRDPNPFKDLAALRRIIAHLRGTPHDLVVTHQSKAGVLGRVAAGRAGRQPLLHSLSMSSFGPGYPRWQDAVFRRLEARLEGATTAYAVAGRDLAMRYGAIGVPADKLRVIRSGVRLPQARVEGGAERERVLADLGLPLDRPLLLYVGSLDTRKNVLALPALLSRLLALHDGTHRPMLAIAGDGPLARPLAAGLDRAGVGSDARLLGFVHDPAPLIAAADAMVLLSSAEGISQVLVQAAAAGTAFVAYDVDGTRELLDAGAEGAVVPLGDLGAAASEIATLLARPARTGSGRGPRAIDVSSWTDAAIAADYRGLLSSILWGERTSPDGGAAAVALAPTSVAGSGSGSRLADGNGSAS